MQLKPLTWDGDDRRSTAHPFADCLDVELRVDMELDEYTWDVFIGNTSAAGAYCQTLGEAKAAATEAYWNMLLDQLETDDDRPASQPDYVYGGQDTGGHGRGKQQTSASRREWDKGYHS